MQPPCDHHEEAIGDGDDQYEPHQGVDRDPGAIRVSAWPIAHGSSSGLVRAEDPGFPGRRDPGTAFVSPSSSDDIGIHQYIRSRSCGPSRTFGATQDPYLGWHGHVRVAMERLRHEKAVSRAPVGPTRPGVPWPRGRGHATRRPRSSLLPAQPPLISAPGPLPLPRRPWRTPPARWAGCTGVRRPRGWRRGNPGASHPLVSRPAPHRRPGRRP